MSEFVTDTHGFYWHITQDPRLSRAAAEIFVDADRGQHRIWVPSITLVEMFYLAERGRLSVESVIEINSLLAHANDSYSVANLDIAVAQTLPRVPRDKVADMPDRIIVATSLLLGLPLITRDEAIQQAGVVPIVW